MKSDNIAKTELLEQVKKLAGEYYRLTGKPLGVTGEVGEYEAARILGLDLAEARTAGYDATDKDGVRYEIKTRRFEGKNFSGQRIGKISSHEDWDKLLVVLLDEQFDAYLIFEADKDKVLKALDEPGSISRNERRALDVPKVKQIGRVKWGRGE